MTRGVAFVGPLPPPVNGFSSVCAMMLARLRARTMVRVFDRAPAPNGRFLTVLGQMFKPATYLANCVGNRRMHLYLALSGGQGQVFDSGYLLLGKLFRRQMFIHHHSFAYINAPTWLSRCVFALVRRDTHIVLSRRMGESLARAYGLDAADIRVVSNAAFYDSTAVRDTKEADRSGALHIGFLSNITFEKGFVEFFGILARLKERGIHYKAHIAGPLSPEARDTFNDLLKAAADVEYVGPVYDAEKDRFYRQLDIFVFPTNYVNEAEPLVVYEAMRHGVFVMACDRGAISEMLCNGAGAAFPAQIMVEAAATRIEEFSRDRGDLTRAQSMAARQALHIGSVGRIELEKLLDCMVGGSDLKLMRVPN